MAEINIEMLKEKLYPAAKALFIIGEILVDESKQHISEEDAIKKIRSYMRDVDVIGSRYCVNKLIEDCMEPQVYNWFEDYGKKYLEVNGFDYPDCCDGCSNNPKNGGSGICNCTLPYMQNPTNYTVPSGDACMANNAGGYVYITSTKLPDASTQTADRIAKAIENMKKYEKR